MADDKIAISLPRWRIATCRVLIFAASLFEFMLPGSVDLEKLARRLAVFVSRGVRARG